MSKNKSKDFTSAAVAALERSSSISGVSEPVNPFGGDSKRKIMSDTKKHGDVRLVPISKIQPDPTQPRKSTNQETIEGLAKSIKEHGMLQPITVEYKPQQDIYLVKLGQRRYEASKLLGLAEIPCIIADDTNDNSRFEQQLIENIQREDFNPLDKARGMLELKKRLGDVPWNQVEEKMGISESRRKQFIRLLDLPEFIQNEIVSVGTKSVANAITEKHARALKFLSKNPELQKKLFNMIKDVKQSISGDHAMTIAKDWISSTQHARTVVFSVEYKNKRELIEKLKKAIEEFEEDLKFEEN